MAFWSTFDCLKGLADDVLSGLSQYLDGNILRDQVAVDQGTKEGILCLGSCRETNLDFFEPISSSLKILSSRPRLMG